ncbi:MAG: hypothetical protein AAF515_06485 [Pseudomonadota bacterium]
MATPADRLLLDEQTMLDLDLFDSERSVFNYLNRCATLGGEAALQRRMRAPAADADAILATQSALTFVNDHRPAFAALPSGYLVMTVDKYLRDSVPVISTTNRVEFMLEASSLRAGDDRFYSRITRGLEVAARLFAALQVFLAALNDTATAGELGPMLDELRELSDQFNAVPEDAAESKYWQRLKVDQLLRVTARAELNRLIELLYEIDALAALAEVCRDYGLLLPEVNDGAAKVSAEGLTHPFVTDAVANPVTLGEERLLLITGPNMAGKTTYLRALALALYLAHLGMGVNATRFEFAPMTHLFTAISQADDLHDGISYFRAEALRVAAVAGAVAQGGRVVAILDEPFKGTNVKDAFDASNRVLSLLATKPDCLFVVTSHLIELAEPLGRLPEVAFGYFAADEQQSRLDFDYRLREGVSSQRLGMRVLEEEGIFELLDHES